MQKETKWILQLVYPTAIFFSLSFFFVLFYAHIYDDDFIVVVEIKQQGPSRARHSSSKDMPDSGLSHKMSESVTPVIAGKDRPMSMHELGSASADRLRGGLSSYESSRPTSERQTTTTTTRQNETINPPGEAVN